MRAVEITTTLIRRHSPPKDGRLRRPVGATFTREREKETAFAVGVDFPGEVTYHCGSARFKVRRTGDVRARSDDSAVFGMHGRTLLPGRPLKPSETRDYMIGRADASELFSDRFITRLKTLNAFVRDAEASARPHDRGRLDHHDQKAGGYV